MKRFNTKSYLSTLDKRSKLLARLAPLQKQLEALDYKLVDFDKVLEDDTEDKMRSTITLFGVANPNGERSSVGFRWTFYAPSYTVKLELVVTPQDPGMNPLEYLVQMHTPTNHTSSGWHTTDTVEMVEAGITRFLRSQIAEKPNFLFEQTTHKPEPLSITPLKETT